MSKGLINQTVTINSRKYDQSIRRSWGCNLVKRNGPLFVFLGIFDEAVSHPDLGYLERGTISYEYYWLDRWFNIFRFHEPDGTLRNFYCNISMPPIFSHSVLDYIDLDIDLLVWPDWSYQILDEIEHEENAQKFEYPPDVKSRAADALIELLELIKNRDLPLNTPGEI